jgi:hypothetical protein
MGINNLRFAELVSSAVAGMAINLSVLDKIKKLECNKTLVEECFRRMENQKFQR